MDEKSLLEQRHKVVAVETVPMHAVHKCDVCLGESRFDGSAFKMFQQRLIFQGIIG